VYPINEGRGGGNLIIRFGRGPPFGHHLRAGINWGFVRVNYMFSGPLCTGGP